MIDEWAKDWGVPAAALAELRYRMTRVEDTGIRTSEAAAQQQVRITHSGNGGRLWRNNVGACLTEDGRQIRYGLCNDSPKINKGLKSSDLIGITPMEVLPVHIGQTWGVFTSIEVKRPGWSYAGTDREKAQLAWLELVAAFGGIAKFSTGGI